MYNINIMVLPYDNMDYDEDQVGATNITELTDVELTNLSNGEVLKYNSTSDKWENFTPTYLDGAGINDNFLIKVVGGATTQTSFIESSVLNTSTSLKTYIPLTPPLSVLAGSIETEVFGGGKTRMHLTTQGIASTNGITITSDGRVGIGVINPDEVLQIDGKLRIEDDITQTLTFYDTHGGSTKEHARIEVDDDGGGADILFYTRPSGGNPPTEKLRINKTGAIGIGGSNYGTAGQVLTSNGSTSSVSWTTPGSVDRINIEVEGATTKKKQIIYDATKTITASDIIARLDDAPDKDQVYYFGTSIPNRWVAAGKGSTNSLAYSSDGISWTGLGKTTFSTSANDVAWNGSIYVAVGQGTNSIAYSSDGITWTGATSSTSIFSTTARGVAWSGTRWVAVGQGTNTLAYSSDGINWTGIGTSIFSSSGRKVVWNGSIFCAVGQGTNTLAYSSDGITWTGLGTSIFSSSGQCIGWNGFMFVAGGDGTNAIAYSYDGISWTGLGTGIVSFCRSIGWDGRKWLLSGTGGTNQLHYSSNGIQWTSIGNIFTTRGNGVLWNGRYWVSGGFTPSHAWSIDGISWTNGSTLSVFTEIVSLAYNGKRENTITFAAGSTANGVVSINGGTLTLSGGGTLDVVSDNYFNQGFTNFALTIK